MATLKSRRSDEYNRVSGCENDRRASAESISAAANQRKRSCQRFRCEPSSLGCPGFPRKFVYKPGSVWISGYRSTGNAVLRGSAVGLASGVEAVTEEDAAGKSAIKKRPLSAGLTVVAYIVGGIIAALIFRGIRRAARTASG